MTFVVAGVVAVLAFVAATASWIFAPIYQAKAEATDEASVAPAPAPTISRSLKEISRWQWVILALLAVLCGTVICGACLNWSAQVLARHSAALLFLLCAALFDYRTHLIPNFLILAMLLSGAVILGGTFLFARTDFSAALLSAAGGFLVCFAVFFLLSLLSRNGLGMGDVKLVAAMAWLLGLTVTLFSVLFGLILCTLIAIGLMLTKKKNKHDLLPLGPFVFVGYILLLIFFRF